MWWQVKIKRDGQKPKSLDIPIVIEYITKEMPSTEFTLTSENVKILIQNRAKYRVHKQEFLKVYLRARYQDFNDV